jgi:flagellar motor switch protein FliG
MLKEDMEVAGPVRQKEVFKVQREVLESVKRLEEEGKIEISSSEEDVLV